MDQRKLDLSGSTAGARCNRSGGQLLDLHTKLRMLRSLLQGTASFLFCIGLSACLSPDGAISFYSNPIDFTGPGALLTSFGNQGTISTSEMFVNFGSKGMAIDASGRMLVPGFIATPNNPNTSNFAVGRFNPDGTIDTSFGLNGIATFQYQSTNIERACAVLVDPADQSIIVGGTSLPNGSGTRTVVFQQLTSNGVISSEPSFNPNMISTPNNAAQIVFSNNIDVGDNNNDDSCVSMVLAPPTGTTVSTGYFAAYSLPSTSEAGAMQMFAVHLAETNESAPTQYLASVDPAILDFVYDVEISPSCDMSGTCPIVVVGNDSTPGGTGDLLIWNFDYFGATNTITNNNVTAYKVSDLPGSIDIPRTSMFDPVSGDLLITGYSSVNPANNNGGHVFFLIRALADASYALDTNFGNQGYAYNPFTTFNSAGFAITEDDQNRILVGGGFTGQNTGLDQVVLRYENSGFLDPSFGPLSGMVTNAVTPMDDVVTGVYFDSTRQRILTVGFSGGDVTGNNGGDAGGAVTLSAYSSN
jgi:hypothetical protein